MQPDASSRYTPRKLFLISFAILFLEMAAIRWLNATVHPLSYFNNLVLMSCFFGLGLGCLLATRKVMLLRYAIPALLVLVIAAIFLRQIGFEVSYNAELNFALLYGEQEQTWLPISAAALLSFLLNVVFFVFLGQELGKQLAAVDQPLKAYAYDIGGSLCGVLAYSALAWLRTPPIVWFAIGLLVLLTLLHRDRRWLLASVVLAVAVMVLMWTTYRGAHWSPYYKVETGEFNPETEEVELGHYIMVDGFRIQDALRFGPETLNSPLWPWIAYYELPYHFKAPEQVLILGAGAGNEAVMALSMGAATVHAVEIDPVIAGYGRTLHPHAPYAHPGATVFVDDARSYVHKTDERYDLIVMSALDSHKQISGMSSIRLENFVYTVESFARIRELLAPDGVFCLSLSSGRRWMADRVYWSLTEAFGQEPRVFQSEASPFNSFSYLYGPDEVFDRDLLPASMAVVPVAVETAREDVILATDNWPHLYLKGRVVPTFHLVVLLAMIVSSFALVVGVAPEVRVPNLHYFFLGAGFMLLETRSITQMALLFGSTWSVNAVVFASILATIFVANHLVQRRIVVRLSITYALLGATLLLGFFFPFDILLGLALGWRLAAAAVAVGLPILWASLVFSMVFREETQLNRAFGSNLLGVVVGGCLEYLSMLWGMNVLYLIALVLYLASLVFLPRRMRTAL